MANTKHAAAREIIIDRLLNRLHGSSVKEMLEAVNDGLEANGFPPVSSNTIRNDIDTIRYVYRRKIRVERRSYENYYRYEQIGNSIFKNTFTFDEIEHLHSALMSILFCDPIQGTLIYESLSRRLSDMLEVDVASEPIVLYKRTPSKSACKIFKSIYQHIRSKSPALITCKSDKKAEEVIVVHPYYIMFDCPTYYLLCHDSTNKRAAKIPIDSIIHITTSYDIEFIPNKDFPLQDFYNKHLRIG